MNPAKSKATTNSDRRCLSTQKNLRLVWDETVKITTALFNNVWGQQSEVAIDNCAELTMPVSALTQSFGFERCP
jgi:hypothetical protein